MAPRHFAFSPRRNGGNTAEVHFSFISVAKRRTQRNAPQRARWQCTAKIVASGNRTINTGPFSLVSFSLAFVSSRFRIFRSTLSDKEMSDIFLLSFLGVSLSVSISSRPLLSALPEANEMLSVWISIFLSSSFRGRCAIFENFTDRISSFCKVYVGSAELQMPPHNESTCKNESVCITEYVTKTIKCFKKLSPRAVSWCKDLLKSSAAYTHWTCVCLAQENFKGHFGVCTIEFIEA